MSKLAKAINSTLTGDVKAARNLKLNYLDVSRTVSDVDHLRLAKKYKIGVKLETSCWLEEGLVADAYHEMLFSVKRAMIEEVFGEFRPLIIEMRSALYDEDTRRVRTLLAQLEEQMFTDGVNDEVRRS
jgi:uncharacterized protein (DUF1810 family)